LRFKLNAEMSDYRPIPCALYSRYELAILRRQRLRLRWRENDNVTRVDFLAPKDLLTAKGEEFLIAEDSAGRSLRLRLDHILEIQTA
jgi:Rho-binding antiterminator